jgi:hypothetical protein
MTVAEFSGKIQGLKDTVQEMAYYTDFIQDLENAFADIPQIKSAPKDVKLLRKNLRELKNHFAKNFDEFEEGDLKSIEQAASEVMKLMFATQKEEANVPMRYRFVSRALNKFNFSRKGNSVKELNKLIKSTADQAVTADGESINNANRAFSAQLEKNIAFYNVLNSKNFFFFFPQYNHVKYMQLSLENLLFFKGFSTNLYVDLSQGDSLFNSLLGYLPPQKLIKLKEILKS